jgi:hypothetical protein
MEITIMAFGGDEGADDDASVLTMDFLKIHRNDGLTRNTSAKCPRTASRIISIQYRSVPRLYDPDMPIVPLFILLVY